MEPIKREDIHIISQCSDLSEKALQKAFKEHVYPDNRSWYTFLRIFFLCVGTGFTVSGIVFFVAYNWADLHKFAKLGLIEALLIGTTIFAVWPGTAPLIRNIVLTASSVLVGVLFAVFGQIYQTGANAYDLFLAWTIFMTLWVFISNFPPLWLLYLLLVNTTIVLFAAQVAQYWSSAFLFNLLFLLNAGVLLVATGIQRYRKNTNIPTYFLNIVALAAVTYSTIGIVEGIFRSYYPAFGALLLSTGLLFIGGLWYGIKINSGFYLSLIPFSLIIMGSAFLIDFWQDETIFLIVSVFIITSVTFVIRNLINLYKK